MKKKAGAWSGRRSSIWRRMLPSMRAMATSTDSPSPQGNDDVGRRRAAPVEVGLDHPPGAADGGLDAGSQGHDQGGAAVQKQERGHGATDEPSGEIAVAGREQGQQGQQHGAERRRRQEGGAGTGAQGDDARPEQFRRPHVPGPGHREQGEGYRRQQAEGGGDRRRLAVDPGYRRHRQVPSGDLYQGEGGASSQDEPDQDAEAAEYQDLHHVNGEDQSAWGAQALEGGDGGGLAVQVAAHGAGDPQPADQQHRQADEGQEQAHALDEPPDAGRRVAGAADPPAGCREGLVQAPLPGPVFGAGGEQQTVVIPDLAARPDQFGLGEGRRRHQQPRPEAEHAGHPVRFVNDGGAHLEGGGADADAPAEAEAEAAEQVRVGNRPPGAVPPLEQPAEGPPWFGPHLADQRIGAVNGLQFDHRPSLPYSRRAGHGAHLDDPGDGLRPGRQVGELFRGRRAVQEPEIDIAAEQPRPVGLEPGDDCLAEAADGGDGADAERDAGEEDPEPAEAMAQLAARQAPAKQQVSGHRLPCPGRRCGRRRDARCGCTGTPAPARG